MQILAHMYTYIYIYVYMGVSINGGTPKWMVDNGKSYWNGWFGGTPILGNLHIHIYIYIYTYTLQRPISFNLLRCRQLHDGCHLPVWLGVPRSGSSMTNKCCFVQEWVADGLTKLMFVLWCLMSFLRIELSNCGESFWTTSFFFRLLLVWDWPLFSIEMLGYEPFIFERPHPKTWEIGAAHLWMSKRWNMIEHK